MKWNSSELLQQFGFQLIDIANIEDIAMSADESTMFKSLI